MSICVFQRVTLFWTAQRKVALQNALKDTRENNMLNRYAFELPFAQSQSVSA
jgi:hypothetical protein